MAEIVVSSNQDVSGNINKLYLYSTISGIYFFLPTIVLFWQSNGLNLAEIMILQSIYSIIVVFLEIPSGYFSDVLGRKKTLVYAAISGILSMFCYTIGNGFFYFLIAEMLFACHISLISGTDIAMAYDSLVEVGSQDRFKKVVGRMFFLNLSASAFSSIIGGFISDVSLRWTFYFMLPFSLALIVLAMSFKEPSHSFIGGQKYKLNQIFRFVASHQKIPALIVYFSVMYSLNYLGFWFYQPYFSILKIDVIYFGFIFAILQLVGAFSSKYTYSLDRHLGLFNSVILVVLCTAISYFLMAQFLFPLAFLFTIMQQFVTGFLKVSITDSINVFVETRMRATVLSMLNSCRRLIYAMILPVAGWIADVYSFSQMFLLISLLTLVFGITFLIYFRKYK